MDPLTAQIADQLERSIVNPVAMLGLGPDLAEALVARIQSAAPVLAAQLSGGADRLATQTAINLMTTLWPHGDPAPEWWSTPLGRAWRRSLGTDDHAVSQSVAAAMLGVHRGTIAQLVHRGTLARHPDGGVSVAAILARRDRLGTRDLSRG